MEENDTEQRLCFKCGKKPIEKPHVLCDGCLELLGQGGAAYWQSHEQRGATVVKVGR
ncbi:hypothetical protein ACFORH_43370 [Amycolatopsis roodepoortensis]|uniref:Uncharacterized protein n=1 Tax=Amycolatopsis roodepoortensis TaxID=700274 RepID=A0ABR9LIL7_9PSEU|nr:hypothetical protein [Amycolatopsis roodepoortensis]MBE1580417.1 hypothetical protein [Amycolatopsis roodepoortensis]